ncbi:MAG TPA: PDZ domain-containing protein, partial [Planctomycetota bacterium]|nr:PDZ domain-containing protein [Planctomycetota bacterium]
SGRIRRSYIGVAGQSIPLHRRLVRIHDLEAGNGVLVVSVEHGSPAEKSGLRDGDIVVALDGHSTAGVDDLHRLLTEERIGRPCALTCLRYGDRRTVQITPEDAK